MLIAFQSPFPVLAQPSRLLPCCHVEANQRTSPASSVALHSLCTCSSSVKHTMSAADALHALSWTVLGLQATGEVVLFHPCTNQVVDVPPGVDPASLCSVAPAQPPAPRRVKKVVRFPRLLEPTKDMSVEEHTDMSIDDLPLTPPPPALYSVVSSISSGSIFSSG